MIKGGSYPGWQLWIVKLECLQCHHQTSTRVRLRLKTAKTNFSYISNQIYESSRSRGISAQSSPLAFKRSPKVDSTDDLALESKSLGRRLLITDLAMHLFDYKYAIYGLHSYSYCYFFWFSLNLQFLEKNI
jgi:hypothetical protein